MERTKLSYTDNKITEAACVFIGFETNLFDYSNHINYSTENSEKFICYHQLRAQIVERPKSNGKKSNNKMKFYYHNQNINCHMKTFSKKPSGNQKYYNKIYIEYTNLDFQNLDNNTIYIEIILKDIYKIRHNNKDIIELFLKKPFNTTNNKFEYSKNYFVEFKNQILRYWILRPVIRFEGLVDFNQLLKILNFSKNKNPKKKNIKKSISNYYNKSNIFNTDQILLYSVCKYELNKYQNEILNFINSLNDKLQFEMLLLISSGKLIKPIDFDRTTIVYILDYQSTQSNKICEVLRILRNQLLTNIIYKEHKRFIFNLKKCFIKVISRKTKKYNNFSNLKDIVDNNDNYSHLKKIKKIFITPNLIIFHEDSQEQGNRILNLYNHKINNFIRVALTDDNLNKISYSYSRSEAVVDNHFYKFLVEGLVILKKTYKFLCYSNSQLKSHSFWMIEEEKDFNYHTIFNKIGDFSKENIIAKNASRKGLAMTTCIFVKEVENIEIKDDIYATKDFYEDEYSSIAEKKKFLNKKEDLNFSDGSGMISTDLALKCSEKFNKDSASAFQIRMGGAKGVLVLNPSLPKDTVWLRKSMIKFNSNIKNELYVIRTSSYSPGFLNRQIISLLNFLGVSSEIFEDLQDQNIKLIEKMRKFDDFSLDIFKVTPFVQKLYANGIFTKKYEFNPFIRGLNSTLLMSSLEKLKNKANILDSNSAKFIGVIDNLGILNQNQIFCLVDRGQGQEVIEGKVVVTKNPCLYVGCIQILEAVDIKELYHLKNVIVFPQKGLRPITQLISNGDLDGDVYFISWNQNLIPKYYTNFPSIQYYEDKYKIFDKTAGNVSLPEKSNFVEKNDIINFFCNFLKNDILGMICNRHLVLSDKTTDPLDKSLIILEAYQRKALDFGKHGENIKYSSLEEFKIGDDGYPHFMEKNKKFYVSKKVLGILYSKVTEVYHSKMNQLSEETYEYNFQISKNGFEVFLEMAHEFYNQYYDDLQAYMFKYKISSEYEFLSSNIIKFSKNKFGKDDYQVIESIKIDVESLISKYNLEYNFYVYYIFIKFWDIIDLKEMNNTDNWIDIIKNYLSIDLMNDILTYVNENFQKLNSQKSIEEISLSLMQIESQSKTENLIKFKLIENIRRAFISAIYFISHFQFMTNFSVLNPEILNNFFAKYPDYQRSKKKAAVYNFYDSYYDHEDSNYYNDENDYNDENYEDDQNNQIYFNNFYSLPWILDIKILMSLSFK
jgi:hypothetical protein